jgi:hypothetical protein
MRNGLHAGVFALALALCGRRLSAQNPVQSAFVVCPTGAPVFSVRQVQTPARLLRDSSRSPEIQPAPVDAPNVVSFIVDTAGVPERASVTRVRVADSTLVDHAIRNLSSWRYRPAIASGCKVRQRVEVAVVR